MKYHTLLFLFLFSMVGSIYFITPTNSRCNIAESSLDLHDLRILLYADMNVGNNFFDVKRQFESWNCSVSVIGPTTFVTSCINTGDSRPILCDLLIDNITSTELQTYDFLFIPSGGYWADQIYKTETLNFIRQAYDLGLWVGSMCIGGVILASVPNLVKAVKMLCHSYSQLNVENHGGILLNDASVISDKRIITGDIGGGIFGGGHTVAPYPEYTAAVVRELLHYSFMKNASIEKIDDVPDKSHRVLITTETYPLLYHSLLGEENQTIEQITLQLYSSDSKEGNHTIPMEKIAENIYEGYIYNSFSGDYIVNVEIQTNQDELQVIRSVFELNTKSIAGNVLLIIVLSSLMSIIWTINQITFHKRKKDLK